MCVILIEVIHIFHYFQWVFLFDIIRSPTSGHKPNFDLVLPALCSDCIFQDKPYMLDANQERDVYKRQIVNWFPLAFEAAPTISMATKPPRPNASIRIRSQLCLRILLIKAIIIKLYMYIVVDLIFAQYFSEFFASFYATFLKKPCKSTMLSMDYQIWRTRKAEAEAKTCLLYTS